MRMEMGMDVWNGEWEWVGGSGVMIGEERRNEAAYAVEEGSWQAGV